MSKEKPDSKPLTDEQRATVQAGVDAVNAQNNGTTAEVVTDAQAEEQFAERFMVGELIKAATKQLKDSQVAFKGATDVQATLAMVIHDGAHALADQAGQTVTVVIDNLDEMLSVGDSTRGEPDQRGLLDDEI